MDKQGKYPIQFWIEEELKTKSDLIRKSIGMSYKNIYKKGVEQIENEIHNTK